MTPDPTLVIQTRIKGLTDITALTSTRIYRTGSVPPTPTFPYLIINATISDIGDAQTNTTDAGHARVQVSVYSSTDVGAETLSQLLKKKVPCKGVILPSGTEFVGVTSIDDAGAIPDMNTDVPVYMRHRDFMVYYAY